VTTTGLPEYRTIGIVGGGQLARMMAQAARPLGLSTVVLDADPHCAASGVADRLIVAPRSRRGLEQLARSAEVITFDLEAVPVDELKRLSEAGCPLRPPARLLEIIQDKLSQRRHMARLGLPVPRFWRADRTERRMLERVGFPVVQKARRGGYDGKGVALLRSADDLDRAIDAPSVLEEWVDLDCELAVLVARGVDGETISYPPVLLDMDPQHHVLRQLEHPAPIEPALARDAVALAERTAAGLESVGILAVEIFVGRDGRLLINEVSPRPHNSGHVTIEGCTTSQFEQHLRAVAGLPLRRVEPCATAVTFNLLGETDRPATPEAVGLESARRIPGVNVHLYDKKEVRPNRKMGHVTIVGKDIEEARRRARVARSLLRVTAMTTDVRTTPAGGAA
jgi:5-(carboxyamino)imidazole ribonucleotide synthase